MCNLTELSPSELDRLMARIPVDTIWGIGRKLGAKLNALGIDTVLDLKRGDGRFLSKQFNVLVERIVAELNGVSCMSLEDVPPAKKQIVASESFGTTVVLLPELQAALASHVSRAARKLRAQQGSASVLIVFFETDRFRKEQPQYNLSISVPLCTPTDHTLILQIWAARAAKTICKPGFAYKKVGVMLEGIDPKTIEQDSLFEHGLLTDKGNAKLGATLDRINQKFGRRTLRSAQELVNPHAWKMHRSMLTPNYTGDWAEILQVV